MHVLAGTYAREPRSYTIHNIQKTRFSRTPDPASAKNPHVRTNSSVRTHAQNPSRVRTNSSVRTHSQNSQARTHELVSPNARAKKPTKPKKLTNSPKYPENREYSQNIFQQLRYQVVAAVDLLSLLVSYLSPTKKLRY